jgi:hypothetical protein
MNQFILVAAISAISTSAVFAGDLHYFSTPLLSGTAQDPLAGLVNTTNSTLNIAVKTWYVDPASGFASNKSTPAIQLERASSWVFDFTNPGAVSFSGALDLGDYRMQATIAGVADADGRQTATGVVHTFSGIGVYDEGTNTFTYDFMDRASNGGGATLYSAAVPLACSDGQVSAFGNVCSSFAGVTPAWEGLALNFVFAEDRSSFTGSLQGINTGGSGLSRITTRINWYVADVPLPAAAWLLGPGLLGLAGARRSRCRIERSIVYKT